MLIVDLISWVCSGHPIDAFGYAMFLLCKPSTCSSPSAAGIVSPWCSVLLPHPIPLAGQVGPHHGGLWFVSLLVGGIKVSVQLHQTLNGGLHPLPRLNNTSWWPIHVPHLRASTGGLSLRSQV